MSNTERQRQFRRRNPDYYRRLQAQRRAAVRAMAAARESAVVLVKPAPLMLPAPVELLIIPGVNAIPATLEAMHAHAPLPASRASAHSPDQSLAA